jgi:hypothetical protein
MSGNHIIITIAAMVLSAVLIINSTKQITSSTDRTIESSKITTAVSLGQKLIKQISSKSFDENCISGTPSDSTGFSNLLKADANETCINNYDDVDDFNNYQNSITNNLGTFNLNVAVFYVNSNNLDHKSYSPTRTKRINVCVSSSALIDTVKLFCYSAY